MELYTLDSSFQLLDQIENYKSLIWTERYSSSGDFELKTYDVATAVQLLPLETFVTIRESTVPMIVEAHKIEKKKNSTPEITITGRSFETVLERRASIRLLPYDETKIAWTIPANKASDAAFLMMRVVLGADSVFVSGMHVLPSRGPALSPKDAIPQISLVTPVDYSLPEWNKDYTYSIGDIVGVADYMYISLKDNNVNHNPPLVTQGFWAVFSRQGALPPEGAVTSYLYAVEPKDLYTSVMDLIQTNHRGLKAVRPTTAGSTVGIEIYNGADLSSQVVFDVKFDQLDEATYLLSYAGSANIAYTYGGAGANIFPKHGDPTAPQWSMTTTYVEGDLVNWNGVTYQCNINGNIGQEPLIFQSYAYGVGSGAWTPWWVVYEPYSGLDRRVIVLDGSQNPYSSTENTVYSVGEIRRALALIELYKYNATALFDGSVSELVASRYNVDYNLGDIVTINGEYGLSEKVRVTEFIRSSDSSGDKAYPTFESVAE